MGKLYIKRCTALGGTAILAGLLGLGTAWGDKDGVPNANANDNANGSASTDSSSQGNNSCAGLPGYSALKDALAAATSAETSGLNNQMWATVVDRDGVVCAVAFSGVNRGAQWPGSRVISAQKANTANAF